MNTSAHSYRATTLILVVVLGLGGLALRVWGAGWSLPYVDHPDEPAVVDVILRVMQGQLNTEHFFYPSLILYLQALVFKLHFWVGQQTGLYGTPLVLPASNHFYTTIPAAFAWARVFTALLCTGTVIALATWGSRLLDRRAALLAALLLALAPWAIIHAHYITVDGPAGLFAMLAVLSALQTYRAGTWRSYLVAGLLVGLATGAKYQNALVVVPLLLAHVFHWQRASFLQLGRLVAAGTVAAATFLLTSPYILLDFGGFLRDMETLFSSYNAGKGDIGHAWPVWPYLQFHFWEGLGPLPFLLALIGAVALWRQDRAQALILLAFPLLLIIGLLRLETHFYRNLLPAHAPLFLVAGVGAVALWDAVRQFMPARWQPPLAIFCIMLLAAFSFVPAYQASARLAQPDARVVAQEWLHQHYPGVRVAGELSHPLQVNGIAQTTNVSLLWLRDASWYQQQGYRLLLANAGRRGKDEWSDSYAPLLSAGEEVYSVGGRFSDHLGPRIDVIDLGLTPAAIDHTRTLSAPVALGPLQLLGINYGRLLRTDDGLEMHPEQPLRPGDILAVTAFWYIDAPVPPDNYLLFLHLRNTADQTPVQRDTPPWQGLFPPATWPVGQISTESLDLALPATLPPGDYRLVLGLYAPHTGVRFPAIQQGHRLPADEIEIGRVTITAP